MEPDLAAVFRDLGLDPYIKIFTDKGATTPLLFSTYVTPDYLVRLTKENPAWPELHVLAIKELLPERVRKLKRQLSTGTSDPDVRPLKKTTSNSSDSWVPLDAKRHESLMNAFCEASANWEEHKELFDGNVLRPGFSLFLINHQESFVCKCQLVKKLSLRNDLVGSEDSVYWTNIHQHTSKCSAIYDKKIQRSIGTYAKK